jgi:protein-S-isoprenylcysteine O-methyltransferase Ste14
VGRRQSAATAAAVDALLLLAFAVPHSVLARSRVKAWWRRRAPAAAHALERSTYGLVAAATMALLFWQWRPLPTLVWDAHGAVAVALRALFWAGWALAAVSVVATNLFDLTGLRQALAAARGRQAAPIALTRRGLYAHARHPLYVGFFLVLWAAPAMSVGRLLFAAGCTAYILVAVRYEERDLAVAHGPRTRRTAPPSRGSACARRAAAADGRGRPARQPGRAAPASAGTGLGAPSAGERPRRLSCA